LVKAKISRHTDGNRKYWLREELAKPKPAIFLGTRTLQNGTYGYEDFPNEDGYETVWSPEPDSFIPGAWICIEGKNPEKVFLSDVEYEYNCVHACPQHEKVTK
jgi:hypothetical protein